MTGPFNQFCSTLALCFSLLFGYGQENGYLQHQPVWTVNSLCAIPNPCIQSEEKNYFLQGDTIIQSLVYAKVFKMGQGSYNWFGPPPPSPGCSGTYVYADTAAAFFLRSWGRKMFIRLPADTSEYLLYDFELSVNDTLPLSYTNFSTEIWVTAIDSIFTPWGFRKRFALGGNTAAEFLIEGVGSSEGLVEPFSQVLECGYSLLCYSLNDTAYFPANGPGCSLEIGFPASPSPRVIRFAPNPCSETTRLQSSTELRNARLQLINCLGQTLLKKESLRGYAVELETGDLPEGIYLALLAEPGSPLSVSKIVVSRAR